MLLVFRDPETGYYEDECSFYAHDREMELKEQEREDRFEAQAEEMLATLWVGEEDLSAESPRSLNDAINPETGCAAAEMKEEEMESASDNERRVA
jgi:hypothetical protein